MLKEKMNFDEMALAFHQANPHWVPNRVNVGKFAKQHGYKYMGQKVNNQYQFFYLKQN